MIGKKNTARLLGACYAVFFGGLIMAVIRGIWPSLPTALALMMFICLGVGFYFTGIWVIIDRPGELDKKFPISGKELRRRTKEFFDWVDSLPKR